MGGGGAISRKLVSPIAYGIYLADTGIACHIVSNNAVFRLSNSGLGLLRVRVPNRMRNTPTCFVRACV